MKTREIQDKLLPNYNRHEWLLRSVLLVLAFVLIVFALSQPQWGEEKKTVERKGVDVIFLLDVSKSMLAEDIKPSRVAKAKLEIEAFVKAFKGHRIGLLTFAGSSFMQTPLTLDYSAFLIFLSGVDVGHVPDPGTSLGAAIAKAVTAFSDEKGKQKALIIFSDGEDHDADMETATNLAKQQNVRIYAIGTATGEGAPIPLRDENGVARGVKKDRTGNIVITQLHKDVLEKVAGETGGLYVPATPSEREVEIIIKHLASLGEKKLEDRAVTEKEDHYQIFVFFALLLLMLEMLVRRGRSVKVNLLPLVVVLFFLNSGFLSTPHKVVEEGNKDFEEKRYQSAVNKYREVQVKNPDDPEVSYNLATSLYKLDQYPAAAANLKKSLEHVKPEDKALQAKMAYNYGNALFRMGDYEGAIEAYKKALELAPDDKDAKYNLEFIQDQKKQSDKENEGRKKDNPDKKKDENKQQDNKNKSDEQNKDQNNQGGGGSKNNNDQSQGQDQKENQKGSGEQDQKQNQGGEGKDDKSEGQNQGKDQQDQGQGKDQKDQENQKGKGESESKENQGAGQQDKQEKEEQGQGSEGEKKPDQGDGQQDQKSQGGQGQESQDKQNGEQKQDQSGQGGQGQDQQEQPQSQGNEPNQNQQQGNENQGQNKSLQGNQPEKEQQGSAGGSASGPGGQETEQQQGAQGGSGKPLQGQMTKESAEYLLASLEESEKKYHVMRKPSENMSENPYVEKDW